MDRGLFIIIELDDLVEKRGRERGLGHEALRPESKLELFEEIILPHLDAAYNLA